MQPGSGASRPEGAGRPAPFPAPAHSGSVAAGVRRLETQSTPLTTEPHPFARFIAVLGRGKSLTRALTLAEAEEAMAMILAGRARPEQIGAFLMLLRVKEETGDEIAGFVRAVRATLPEPAIRADLDWPSYAGKRRRLPWFLLAALTLADAGWRVAMHGLEGHTAGRLYAREAIARLGLPIAGGFDEATAHLEARNFVYLPLDALCPRLAELFALRAIPACARRSIRWRGSSTRSARPLRSSRCFIPATWRSTATPRCGSAKRA